jgi:hypothetical protein
VRVLLDIKYLISSACLIGRKLLDIPFVFCSPLHRLFKILAAPINV